MFAQFEEAPICSLDSSLYFQTHVICWSSGILGTQIPGLEVDSFVHEVRTFDRHLPACGKVDQSEAIFICTLMQDVLAYRFPPCVRVSHHQLHVMTWAGCVCPLQLFIKLILGLLF
jgi:hypothetical protein